MRTIILAILLACTASVVLRAQQHPISGSEYTVTYRPTAQAHFAAGAPLQLVYAYNYWGTRSATRLALLENVLRPDSGREHRAVMRESAGTWTAGIPIPPGAAVLSYYVTDGSVRDDNGERTYVLPVVDSTGLPVRNASYFMVPFLQLAGASVADRLREAEAEVRAWPENFRTYSQYFSLLLEEGRSSPAAVAKITAMLDSLETRYGTKEEFLNLAARTYFYLLRDTERAQDYKERIPPVSMWPEVVTIFDRRKVLAERAQVSAERSATRMKLLNAPLPDVAFVDLTSVHKPLREEPGKVLVVYFWSVESQYSRMLAGPLQHLLETHGSKGLRVVAVNLDTDPETARAFIATAGMPFEHRLNNGDAIMRLGVDDVPVVIVADAQRVVRLIATGADADVERQVESVVKSLLP